MSDFSGERVKFVEALDKCRAILSRGPGDHAKWQREARAAVQQLYGLVEGANRGGADLGLSLPLSVGIGLIDFINGDLQRSYLWNDVASITALPAPAAWRHKLDEFIEDLGGQKTPAVQTPSPLLTNWREILVALGMKNNAEDREKVRNLNTQYDGPIVIPKQGAQPKANRDKLIAWWNGLEAQWTVGYQRGRDARPTAESQHPYGRDGMVAPEIGGVKKPRNDRRG